MDGLLSARAPLLAHPSAFAYMTPLQAFLLRLRQLVAAIEERAAETGSEIIPGSWTVHSGGFPELVPVIPTLELTVRTVPPLVSSAEVQAAFEVLAEEFELPTYVRSGPYLESFPEGEERDLALLRLRAADLEAEAAVRQVIRRALEAAARTRTAD